MEVNYTHLGWDEEDLHLGSAIEGTLVLQAIQNIDVESIKITLMAHRRVRDRTLENDVDNRVRKSSRQVFERESIVADSFSVPAESEKTLAISIAIPTARELTDESPLSSYSGLSQENLRWTVRVKVDTPGIVHFYDKQSVSVSQTSWKTQCQHEQYHPLKLAPHPNGTSVPSNVSK